MWVGSSSQGHSEGGGVDAAHTRNLGSECFQAVGWGWVPGLRRTDLTNDPIWRPS